VSATTDLQGLIKTFGGGKRNARGIFDRKGKRSSKASRLDEARRLAALAADAQPQPALLSALEAAAGEFADEGPLRAAYARALERIGGRDPEAIAEFEEALRLAPDDAGLLCEVAAVFERMGRTDLAVARLTRAVDLLVAARMLDEATTAARRLIALEPESLQRAAELVALLRAHDPASLVEALDHLAAVYRGRGKLGQEADACRELLTLAPDRADVQQRLADIYVCILEVDPNDGDAWLGLATVDDARAQLMADRLAAAQGDAGSFVAGNGDPSSHESYVARKAQELIDAGDMVGASLCLERAAKTNATARNFLRLARCYQSLHREPDAVKAGLAALAAAHTEGGPQSLDDIMTWLRSLWPDVEAAYFETAILKQRPESVDTLHDELVERWLEATASTGVGAGREAE